MMKIIPLIILISTSIKKKHTVWLLTIDFKTYRVYEIVRMSLKQLRILPSVNYVSYE